MTCKDSLDRFGTTVFGFEFMSKYINYHQDHIDCSNWYQKSPKIYRPAIRVAIDNAIVEFLGLPFTEEVFYSILNSLHKEIWRELERGDYNTENLN